MVNCTGRVKELLREEESRVEQKYKGRRRGLDGCLMAGESSEPYVPNSVVWE